MPSQDKVYLGSLCGRGHDHDNTGRSLRYLSAQNCIECSRITSKVKWEKKSQIEKSHRVPVSPPTERQIQDWKSHPVVNQADVLSSHGSVLERILEKSFAGGYYVPGEKRG